MSQLTEFALIADFFKKHTPNAALSIGDDCAEWPVPAGQKLAITTDTLVSGVHFHAEAQPRGIGHKALAVSLSDLAAQGATPAFALLNLTLPEADESWIKAFAQGFHSLARAFGIELIGGDTTRGPLSITVTAAGYLPEGQGLRRSGAAAGDDVWVTGKLGLAAMALTAQNAGLIPFAEWEGRLNFPTPRNKLAGPLLGLASAAIDISDGLLADAEHLAVASQADMCLLLDELPMVGQRIPGTTEAQTIQAALSGGDDYELLFTAKPENADACLSAAQAAQTKLTKIGNIESGTGQVRLELGAWQREREVIERCMQQKGYQHF